MAVATMGGRAEGGAWERAWLEFQAGQIWTPLSASSSSLFLALIALLPTGKFPSLCLFFLSVPLDLIPSVCLAWPLGPLSIPISLTTSPD